MSDIKALDLYDFPTDYIGRKSYVSVGGHVRSVPKYKTYKGSDSRNHILPEYGGEPFNDGPGSAYYMPDKQPYLSPLDGSYVTSRSQHTEHMRRHNVVEAGDMPLNMGQRNRDTSRISGRDIANSIKQLGGH